MKVQISIAKSIPLKCLRVNLCCHLLKSLLTFNFAATLYIKPLRAWVKCDQVTFCSNWLAAKPDKIVYCSSVLGIAVSHDNNIQMKTVINFDYWKKSHWLLSLSCFMTTYDFLPCI